VALAIVLVLPLLVTSGVATAKVKTKGCHKTHSCKASGGGSSTGSGTGGAPNPFTIPIDPDPLVETSTSSVAAVIQVETSPSFAGDAVDVSSSQFVASCQTTGFAEPEETTFEFSPTQLTIPLILDDDGNATATLLGEDCAPGSSVIEADLVVAPFDTALGTLTLNPPVVTPPGIFGYPTTSGTVTTGEVETGDTEASGDSDVDAVFYVETDPVYAEQQVEISFNELEARCLASEGYALLPPGGLETVSEAPGGMITPPVPTTLDDDGNAVFVFLGSSCAAGSSDVIADVLAGTHPTYTTTFNINPPQPTI
jgi:hypothetical protein